MYTCGLTPDSKDINNAIRGDKWWRYLIATLENPWYFKISCYIDFFREVLNSLVQVFSLCQITLRGIIYIEVPDPYTWFQNYCGVDIGHVKQLLQVIYLTLYEYPNLKSLTGWVKCMLLNFHALNEFVEGRVCLGWKYLESLFFVRG